MPGDRVKIVIEVSRDISEEVRANLSEYLEDFYGKESEDFQSMTVSLEEIS